MTAAPETFKVLIAGGGVAGLEGALALRDLAGDRISTMLLARDPEFVNRPMTVREPFAYRQAQRYPLRQIADDVGFELLEGVVAKVDLGRRTVQTAAGAQLRYDALLLALGARMHARYQFALTIDDSRLDDLLHGLIQDIEGGYVKRLAFVVPAPMAWPLPIYELAMMTARRAYDMNVELAITVLTPEDAPLAIFGQGASDAASRLLAEQQIEVIGSAYCEIPRPGVIEISPDERRLEVDRIVALPQLEGPAIPGLPPGPDGFIPIDANCRVRGTQRVYAAGDATDFAIKYGGIAAQQADTAAHAIAALAGAAVVPESFEPVVHGVLLTGGEPRYLSAQITGGHGTSSELTADPGASPPAKIAAKYLAPYLDQLDRSASQRS
ncbi:MAG: FAD-dependent oxidoreductase [Solirubrobacteraceae bacterium]|jgi:sulfide:quinone oxidoreductase